jgi:hypothetical protein
MVPGWRRDALQSTYRLELVISLNQVGLIIPSSSVFAGIHHWCHLGACWSCPSLLEAELAVWLGGEMSAWSGRAR